MDKITIFKSTDAGLARSSNIYPITIPEDVIKRAIENTKQLIIDNCEVIKKEE